MVLVLQGRGPGGYTNDYWTSARYSVELIASKGALLGAVVTANASTAIGPDMTEYLLNALPQSPTAIAKRRNRVRSALVRMAGSMGAPNTCLPLVETSPRNTIFKFPSQL